MFVVAVFRLLLSVVCVFVVLFCSFPLFVSVVCVVVLHGLCVFVFCVATLFKWRVAWCCLFCLLYVLVDVSLEPSVRVYAHVCVVYGS